MVRITREFEDNSYEQLDFGLRHECLAKLVEWVSAQLFIYSKQKQKITYTIERY